MEPIPFATLHIGDIETAREYTSGWFVRPLQKHAGSINASAPGLSTSGSI
ncbi:hypothetical protein RSPO_m00756 (plasmid) [Ralstonia solanacearum Po82]|uniref:Uncharacterized protein n=1 Tax=Ralstonia solanacearum (strain Po82) TaxID=1031711 RepID=F6G8V4_RALS8|nr:hypothetical protein [Ralstonia solanacearum]AEG71394.1 hypothetical protein RSPO_m00756 [Ralstonia solanacearum Po82]